MKKILSKIIPSILSAVMLCSCVYVTFESGEEIPKPEPASYTGTSEASDTEYSETENTVFTETEKDIPEETESPEYVTETDPTESEIEKLSVEKDGSYTTPEDVAEYIHTFGTLPQNFITKSEAKALGWDSSKGNLWDVAPGKSIGGD